jgi:hypothetical protein
LLTFGDGVEMLLNCFIMVCGSVFKAIHFIYVLSSGLFMIVNLEFQIVYFLLLFFMAGDMFFDLC